MHNKQIKTKTSRRWNPAGMVQPVEWLSTQRHLRAAEVISICTIMLPLLVSCQLRLPVPPLYETQKSQVFLSFAAEAWNLVNPTVYCYKTWHFVPILSQRNPIHVFTPHLCNMPFNNRLTPAPRYSSIFFRQDLRPNLLYVFLIPGLDGPGIEFRWVENFRAGVLIETRWRLCMMIWKKYIANYHRNFKIGPSQHIQ